MDLDQVFPGSDRPELRARFTLSRASPDPSRSAAGASAVLEAGAAEIDITPHLDLPMAGYSTRAKSAIGVSGRLFARVLFLADADGGRVAICVADLMSGTRYLHEKVAATTTGACGIGVDRLILIGTHTHTAPAWIYGNSLYDTFASHRPGFDRGLADWLADRIAGAIVGASERAVPAVIGTARESVWNVSRNRSYPAFVADPSHVDWNAPGSPGQDPPADLRRKQKAVDPRLRILAAFREDDRRALGAVGFFGAHFTSVGSDADFYSPDAAGHAVRAAREALLEENADAVVALAPSAAGDVNLLRPNVEPVMAPGPALAAWVGERLGAALTRGVRAARANASPVTVRCRHAEPGATAPAPSGDPGTTLASRWAFGAPTLGGSEESRTLLHARGLVREGMTGTDFPADDPQCPKVVALGPLQRILASLLDLDPAPVMPLHLLDLDGFVVACVPGEPTTLAARQIEERVRAIPGVDRVVVVGYAGDYGGYLTTTGQYEAQHYEGASTLRGKNATSYLADWLAHLAGTGPLPAPDPEVRFDTGWPREEFRPESDAPYLADPRPEVKRRGPRVTVRWRMRRGSRILFAEAPLVRVEERAGGVWRTLTHRGRDLDDVEQAFRVRRLPRRILVDWFRRVERWTAKVDLPRAAAESGRPLRIVVLPRDRFPGCDVGIPPAPG